MNFKMKGHEIGAHLKFSSYRQNPLFAVGERNPHLCQKVYFRLIQQHDCAKARLTRVSQRWRGGGGNLDNLLDLYAALESKKHWKDYFLEEWHSLCEWEYRDRRYSPVGKENPHTSLNEIEIWPVFMFGFCISLFAPMLESLSFMLWMQLEALWCTCSFVGGSEPVAQCTGAPTQNNPETQTESETKLT